MNASWSPPAHHRSADTRQAHARSAACENDEEEEQLAAVVGGPALSGGSDGGVRAGNSGGAGQEAGAAAASASDEPPSTVSDEPRLTGDAADEDEAAQIARAIAASLQDATPAPPPRAPPVPQRSSAADEPEPEEGVGGEEVERVEYQPAVGWLESELKAREALAKRLEERRRGAPPRREPQGMDQMMKRSEQIEFVPTGVAGQQGEPQEHVPVNKATADGTNVTAAIRRSPGYDLVRVGNFSERVDDGTSAADIAFFHHFPTLHEIYDEGTYHRQRLVRECCGALRDVCDTVFGYDAAKVTRFAREGASNMHP